MIDIDTQQINLDDLTRMYLEQTDAAEAAGILRASRTHQSPIELSHLLRDHTKDPNGITSQEEIHQRAAFDTLLEFYSIVEIACLIRYVPERLPESFSETAHEHLSETHVKRYYEEYYPVLLPRLFLSRLHRQLSLYEELPADPTPVHRLFVEFLGMISWVRDNKAIETFLWFLDDGRLEGYGIEHTLAVVEEPEQFLERILKPPAMRDPLDLSLRGVQEFVAFCLEFDDLLQRSTPYPLFQSAQSHYFSYWFEHIGEKVGTRVNKAIQGFLHWSAENNEETVQAKEETKIYVEKVEGVLKRLTSVFYSQALRQAAASTSTLVTTSLIFGQVSDVPSRVAYTYEVMQAWAKLPDGWSFHEVAAVGVDAQDNVYVFNRGEHPMMVFDRHGNFLRSWGEGLFQRAHGITMGLDETVFCTDDGDHTVRKCTLEGKVLFTLGMSGKPAPFMSGEPFNRCTHVAIDPRNGDFYVSDGYCNARVHKYTPDGKLLFSWGKSGTDPGEFNIPHNIATDKDGWVYVADRENHRIQVFDANGRFEAQWGNMARPCGLCIDQAAALVYIGELGVAISANAQARRLGPRVSIYHTCGTLLARLGDQPEGEVPGQFIAPHGICVDSRGDIYVGEVSWTHTGSKLKPPRELRSLQKLVRKS